MSTNPPPLPEEHIERSEPTFPFRFSMRTMMVAMTVFAVGCAAAAILPTAITQFVVGLLWIAGITWLIAGVFFAQGDVRAFCIGGLVVFSSMWTGIGGRFMGGFHEILSLSFFASRPGNAVLAWIDLLAISLFAAANGWFCIQARHYFLCDTDDR